MAKRKTKKKVPRRMDVKNAEARIRKALAKQTKAVLIDLVMDLASHDRAITRDLEERFNIEAPTNDLVAATRHAISDATAFDERESNYNFDYDYRAYATIQRNLQRLVDLGCFSEAMELSLDLMSQGSYQVESSDEGLMTDDIEECLQVVVRALKKSDLPAKKVVDWCKAMEKNDRVGFICEDELETLREHLQV